MGHSIMMGSIHLNNFTDGRYTQVKDVLEIFPHPNYSTLISDYDLALLHLAEPFELTDYVQTVCLAKEGMEEIYEPGTAMWVSGWGAKQDMGKNRMLLDCEPVSSQIRSLGGCIIYCHKIRRVDLIRIFHSYNSDSESDLGHFLSSKI